MRSRAGYSQGAGVVLGGCGMLLVIPLIAAFKFLWAIAWPIMLIFGAFAVFIGGCFLVMGICKVIIFVTDRKLARADPKSYKLKLEMDREIEEEMRKLR